MQPERRGVAAVVAIAWLLAGACSAANVTPPPTGPALPTPGATASSDQGPASSGPAGSAPTGQTPGPADGDIARQFEPFPTPSAPAGPPSSQQLITQAVANGTLDPSTALLYRIWAQFGDPQLPAQFAGPGPTLEDTAIGMQTAAGQGDIPDDLWARMLPYLVRPTDSTSAFYPLATGSTIEPASAVGHLPGGGGAANPDALTSLQDCSGSSMWASEGGANDFKIWETCSGSYKTDLAAASSALDSVWAKETDLMGDPLPDDGTGGDTGIDFYLVDSLTQCPPNRDCPNMPSDFLGLTYETSTWQGNKSSAFVIIPRSVAGDITHLKSVMAHELWHVLEDANNANLYKNSGTYWLVEASAKWAEWQFVPEGRRQNVYPWYSTFQGDDTSMNAPQIEGGAEAYRSFIWPLFMQQATGGDPVILGQAWHALQRAAYDTADKTLDGVFSFDDHFDQFAEENLNEHLVPNDVIHPLYDAIDPNFPVAALSAGVEGPTPYGARREDPVYVQLTPEGQTVDYDLKLDPLTSHYRHFSIANEVEAVTIDLSQLDGGDVVASALAYVSRPDGTEGWERREIPAGSTTWCLEDPDNHVSQFELIISNASFTDGDAAQGHYSVTGRDRCAEVHGNLVWTYHMTDYAGRTEDATVWLDVKLKPIPLSSGAYIDDGSSFTFRGLRESPDQPAQSPYDCATVDQYSLMGGTGTNGPGSPGAYLGLAMDQPDGAAYLNGSVQGKEHDHYAMVGPADCAEVYDYDQTGGYSLWCKPLTVQDIDARGTPSTDGKSVDMTCEDTRVQDLGGGTKRTETVSMTGTLYITPVDQPSNQP
jgi:hypothetical protein